MEIIKALLAEIISGRWNEIHIEIRYLCMYLFQLYG